MLRSKHFLLFFWVVAIIGSALFLGCAATPEAGMDATPEQEMGEEEAVAAAAADAEVAVQAAADVAVPAEDTAPDEDAVETAEAEEMARRAAEMMAGAKDLVDQGQFEDAAAPLAALVGMADCLGEEQKAELQAMRQAVADATGLMPGMSKDEKKAMAQEAYEAVMAAYERGEYLDGQKYAELVDKLDVSLGFFKNRKLKSRRKKMASVLGELQAAYESGKAAYENGDFARAKAQLGKVAANRVSLGADVDQEVAQLLASAEAEAVQQQAAQVLDYEAAVKALTEKADAMIATRAQIEAKMAEADEAIGANDLQTAKERLAEVLKLIATPEATELRDVGAMADKVARQMAWVDGELAKDAQEQRVREQIADMVNQAGALAQDDPLAAEAMVTQARSFAAAQGIGLTDEQMRVCDQVTVAITEKFGSELSLRRREYGQLVEMADMYAQGGEPAKGQKMVGLVLSAPARMVPQAQQQEAQGKVGVLEALAQEQRTAADRMVQWLDGAKEAVAAGRVQEAMDTLERGLAKADEENMRGAALVKVLSKGAEVLKNDVQPAVTGVSPGARQIVDQALAAAGVEAAYARAKYYLEKNNPELAEGYLETVATDDAATPAYAEWAKAQLEGIEQVKALAPQARMREIQRDLERLHALAQEVVELAREGRLSKVQSARKNLADARTELELTKARLALERGDLDAAAKLLAAIPAESMSESCVKNSYEPLVAQVEALGAAEAKLQALEGALGQYDFEAASRLLPEASVGGAGSAPLVAWRNALARVLDEARTAQEPAERMAARAARLLADYRNALSAATVREDAWQAYYDAVKTLLEGKAEEALQKLSAAAGASGGLLAAESDNARKLVATLSAGRTKALGMAEAVLANAQSSYARGAYIQADGFLRELRGMPEFAMDTRLQAAAKRLAEKLAQKEAEAADLYEQAVAARRAEDAATVGSLVRKLKMEYSNTKTYRKLR